MKTIKITQTKNTEAFQYLFSELNNIINDNNNSIINTFSVSKRFFFCKQLKNY